MKSAFLELLECPFCGTPLHIVESPSTRSNGDDLEFGALGCECCAYPVVEGIPVVRADDFAKSLLKALDQGDIASARARFLCVEVEVAVDLVSRMSRRELSYGAAIDALSPNGEGTYFAYRFSDPTFYLTEALLQVLLARPDARGARVVDLCGGSGHLTRVMGQCLGASAVAPPIVADYFPWKLWLAKRLVSPEADAICVDANSPLPFQPGSCSFVLCADAFEYIWNRRLFAEEMYRLLRESGVVVITHAHNSWADNPSMGMPLSPGGYTHLGRRIGARVYGDDTLRTRLLADGTIALSHPPTVDALTSEPSFTLVGVKGTAGSHADVFVDAQRIAPPPPAGEWRINPLYMVTVEGERARLTLTFPTAFYEFEFGGCRAYLPESLELDAAGLGDLSALRVARPDLVARRVLLNMPVGYL
jgi:uncharacterized protein YbaR (Trm112 family)/SAM-dependent methyltransferase